MSALIIICGTPCSGKTTVSTMLRQQIEQHNTSLSVVQVTDFDAAISSSSSTPLAPMAPIQTADNQRQPQQPAHLPRKHLYKDFATEKKTRAQLRTNVDRALSSPNTVVIVDSLNYIKGFRYELFCIAKTLSVSYAVIHTTASKEECAQRDSQKDTENEQWGPDLLNSLCNRFETPQQKNRWDSPLYTIDSQNDPIDSYSETLQDIIDGLSGKNKNSKKKNSSASSKGMKKLNASMASKFNTIPAVNDLGNIDRVSRSAEDFIIDMMHKDTLSVGQCVQVPNSTVSVQFQRIPTANELRDMRRSFLNYCRMHPLPAAASSQDSVLLGSYLSFVNEQLKMVRR